MFERNQYRTGINFIVHFYIYRLLTEDRIKFIEEEEWKMESTDLTVSDIDVDIRVLFNWSTSPR
jgi:hypothetical protein